MKYMSAAGSDRMRGKILGIDSSTVFGLYIPMMTNRARTAMINKVLKIN